MTDPARIPAGVWRASLGFAATLALALRLPTLALREIVEGDGVHYAWLARALLAGDASGLANPYWSNLWPGVIAAASAVTGLDPVAAGRWASLAAGVLLAAGTGLLAERVFGRAAGIVAALAVAVHPWLIHFSTLVYTESLFAVLLVAVLLAADSTMREPRPARAMLLGVAAGGALLTRPEAWAAILAAMGGLLACRRHRAAAIAAFILAACVLGRAGLVHRHHGRWDFGIGSKGTVNLLLGLAATDPERERLVREVDAEGGSRLEERSRQTSLVRLLWSEPHLMGRHYAGNLSRAAAACARVFPPLPAAPGYQRIGASAALCLTLGAAGAVLGLRARRSRGPALLVLATLGLHLAGLAALLVHDRLVVALAPLFVVLLAGGVARATAVRPRLQPGLLGAVAATLVLCGPVSLAAVMRAERPAYAAEPPVQREAARWLASRVPPPVRIMSPTRATAYYLLDDADSEGDVDLPWGGLAEVLAVARGRGVDVIVASEWHLDASAHPAAAELTAGISAAGIEHLATLGRRPERIFVYRVREP